jgi:pyruvate dehydrogenase E2 component (dihydrolipoamide acetyltransferase)
MKWYPHMRTAITLPDLGVLNGARVTLSAWFALPGDRVLEGDRLVEVLTEGATFDVPCPASGCLVERRALPRDVLTTGQVLGVVESPDEVS